MVKWLRDFQAPMPYATACLPDCSPARNAWKHQENRYFYILDLHNAYGTIKAEWVAEALAWAKQELWVPDEAVLEFLREYCMTPEGCGLMTGPAASPDLFNLTLAVRVDQELGDLCKKWNLTYTRYLDDLVFSGNEPIGRHKRAAIRKVIEDAGLTINHRKCQVLDIEKHPVHVTGIGIRRERLWIPMQKREMIRTYLYPPRKWVRRMSGLLYRLNNGEDINPHYIIGMWSVIASCWATYTWFYDMPEEDLMELYRTILDPDELQERLDSIRVLKPARKGSLASMTKSVNRVRSQMIVASIYVLPYRIHGEKPPPLPDYVMNRR